VSAALNASWRFPGAGAEHVKLDAKAVVETVTPVSIGSSSPAPVPHC
jgi:hypothetical protein